MDLLELIQLFWAYVGVEVWISKFTVTRQHQQGNCIEFNWIRDITQLPTILPYSKHQPITRWKLEKYKQNLITSLEH
ncbi:unnamed protein product [Ceutorhynchus assimilis]|uniref:Uncharacterized protein n=1 Tax=Ceutorhynchus assimilis TaxID=467358 RepID=A0A9N9MAJ4_9CUCU|nr:unnamed protein product [Ceutorhynchus assimilis]